MLGGSNHLLKHWCKSFMARQGILFTPRGLRSVVARLARVCITCLKSWAKSACSRASNEPPQNFQNFRACHSERSEADSKDPMALPSRFQLRDSSVRAGLAFSLGMTRGRPE